MHYTIGVQRWPLPFYKKYKVRGHQTETVGLVTRLVLTCADGSVVAVPRLDRKKIKVYPDYLEAQARAARIKAALAAQQQPAVEPTA